MLLSDALSGLGLALKGLKHLAQGIAMRFRGDNLVCISHRFAPTETYIFLVLAT
jgi:hypothetical protein